MEKIKKAIIDYFKQENIEIVYFNDCVKNDELYVNPLEIGLKVDKKDLNKWNYFVSCVNQLIEEKSGEKGGKNKRLKKSKNIRKKKKVQNIVQQRFDDGVLNIIIGAVDSQNKKNISSEIIYNWLYSLYEGLQNKYYTVFPSRENFTIICKVTHRCNLDCKHCYDKENREKCKVDMSVEVYDKMLYLASRYTKNLKIIYHGGEPTVVGKEWYKKMHEEIIPKYPMLNIDFGLMSNGLIINQEWIDLLNKYAIKPGISYQAQDQIYIRVSDQLNIDEKKNLQISNTVLNVLKSDMYGGVIDVVNKLNYKNMIETYEFYKELKRDVSLNLCYKSNLAEQNNLEVPLEEYISEYKKFFSYWLYDKDGRNERMCGKMLNLVIGSQTADCAHSDCRGGWMEVNPIGEAYQCGRPFPERYSFGNILNHSSIEEINENSEGYKLFCSDTGERFNNCKENCDYYDICRGECSVSHVAYTGSCKECSEYICNLFKEKFKAVYDILREIDLVRDELNPHAKKIMIENGFYSIKEINKILKEVGVNIPLKYDPNNLIKCSEYQVFRGVNYKKSNSCQITRHIDFIESYDESEIEKNIETRKIDLINFLQLIAQKEK